MAFMPEILWLAGGGALIVAVVASMLLFSRRSHRTRTVERVKNQFVGVPIQSLTPGAHFCGMERSWDGQWCGDGVLLVTEEMLYFRLYKRNLDLSVPLDRVEDVRVESGDGLKTLCSRRLQVTYRGMDDEVRVAGWNVTKPHEWVRCLKEIMEGGKGNS